MRRQVRLTSIDTIATGDSPYAVSVDPSGRFVCTAAINTNGVYGYTSNSTTGAIKEMRGSPVPTDIAAPDHVVDPAGRFLLVAEDCGANTAGISVYTNNAFGGKLTAVAGSPFLPASGFRYQ